MTGRELRTGYCDRLVDVDVGRVLFAGKREGGG
jgi:hypothetical protein